VFLKNTDKLLWSDRNLIGGKTGYTCEAGHCFVCAAERQNKRIIAALLGSPSRKLLWKETEELIHKGFDALVDMDLEAGTVQIFADECEKRSSSISIGGAKCN
jgi:D-alanyl-D-alanine carboxypeptidase